MDDLGRLRGIQQSELELMRSWRNAPGVRANMYTRHEISPEEHMAWWERTSGRQDRQYFMYERDGVPMGIVGLTDIDLVNGNCSWAFYADANAARGTGSRMEYLALEHVFGALCLRKLHCEVLAFNVSVIALHQKFGFQIEGKFREHHVVDGENVDILRLGLLAPEWTAKREEMYRKLTRTNRAQ